MLLATEKAVRDRGYQGDRKIIGPDEWKNRDHRRAMSIARARHENINGKLKNFNCLSDVYRHDRQKHCTIFKAVITIIQIEINEGVFLPKQLLYEGVDQVEYV